jgi:hypothetical protein
MNSAKKANCKFDMDNMFVIQRDEIYYGVIPIRTSRCVTKMEMATLVYAYGVNAMKADQQFSMKCSVKGVQEYRVPLRQSEKIKISLDTASHIGEYNLQKLSDSKFEFF